jgi:uncharacterized protein (TIGR03437 family)
MRAGRVPTGDEILANGWPMSNFPPLSRWNFQALLAIVITSQTAAQGNITSITTCSTTSAAPSIKPGGVVSASAFGQFSSIAPNTWIEIYGTNLAADWRGWTGSDFNGASAPTSLDGTSVTVGGQSAFIDYISPGQVNAQVPSNVRTGSQSLIVTTAAGASSAYTVTVNATQPGLLAPNPSFVVGGKQYVAALFSDGVTFAIPPAAIPACPRAARSRATILLFTASASDRSPRILLRVKSCRR